MPINVSDVENLIQDNIQTALIQPLEESSKFLSIGAQIVPSSTPVTFPRLAANFSVSRYGESEEIVENDTDEVFDTPLKLMPSTLESYKGLIRLSNESLRQSSQALDSVLTNRLVRDFQTAIDADAFSDNGDGVTASKGILAASWGVPVLDVSTGGGTPVAGALTYDHLHDALGTLLGNDAPTAGLKWLLDPATLVKLRKVKDTTGRYILDESVTASPSGMTLLGVPVTVTKRLEAGTVGKRAMLINPASWVIVRDQNPTVKVLTERYAEFDEIGIRVTARYDWGVLEPAANVIIDGIA